MEFHLRLELAANNQRSDRAIQQRSAQADNKTFRSDRQVLDRDSLASNLPSNAEI
jgi:hypothetical protein